MTIPATFSHYEIIRKIGEGGMGEVFLARDTVLDRIVALKVLHPQFAMDEDRMARFVQEARTVSAIDHPNVAHLYQIGEADGRKFIALQFIEGKTLSEKIEERPLPLFELIDISTQVTDALQEAHSKGIIHRDIKPANIMVTARGQAKVLDFGLAKAEPSDLENSAAAIETKPGLLLGTIQYMSPEQALGKTVDPRSDIFSFGLTMYEIATCRQPFASDNPISILQKILNEKPESIASISPMIPAELERIIFKCIEKEPERRYQTALELLVDLRNLKRSTESGETTAKHSIKPQRSLAVRLASLGLLFVTIVALVFALRSQDKERITSLAVLPFVNETSDPNTEYLSDGITDSTINILSQLPKLKVLARGTVFTYKGAEMDPRKVGRDLNVDAIVTGSIFHQSDRLRIQVNLVRVADGAQLWGKQYDRKLSDIFAVQTEISNTISRELKIELTGEQQKQLNKQYTENIEAYQLYLKGRYYWNKRTEADFQRAIEAFNEAIRLDSDYALAYAGLADTYSLLSNWGFVPSAQGYALAKTAALKALSIDDKLAEAYTSLAAVNSSFEWRWPEAEKRFQRAIELNPNYSTAHHWYAFHLSVLGKHNEAYREIKMAQQLDPLSLIINANVGFTLYVARRYDEAIEQLKKTTELDPSFALCYQYLGYAYEAKKMYMMSIASAEKAVEISPSNLTFQADLARAYAVAGRKEESEAILNRLLKASQTKYVTPFDIASVYTGLGSREKALTWLEKAYLEHADQVTYIKMDPRFDLLRNEPRFQQLLRQIGLV